MGLGIIVINVNICKAAYKSAVETHIESVHKKELKKRNESVHDGKQHYCNCDKCEYEAAQKFEVKTHIESVHNGQGPGAEYH